MMRKTVAMRRVLRSINVGWVFTRMETLEELWRTFPTGSSPKCLNVVKLGSVYADDRKKCVLAKKNFMT